MDREWTLRLCSAQSSALDIFRKPRSSRRMQSDHRQLRLKHPAGSLFIAHPVMVICHMFHVKLIGSRSKDSRMSGGRRRARAIGQYISSSYPFTRERAYHTNKENSTFPWKNSRDLLPAHRRVCFLSFGQAIFSFVYRWR